MILNTWLQLHFMHSLMTTRSPIGMTWSAWHHWASWKQFTLSTTRSGGAPTIPNGSTQTTDARSCWYCRGSSRLTQHTVDEAIYRSVICRQGFWLKKWFYIRKLHRLTGIECFVAFGTVDVMLVCHWFCWLLLGQRRPSLEGMMQNSSSFPF